MYYIIFEVYSFVALVECSVLTLVGEIQHYRNGCCYYLLLLLLVKVCIHVKERDIYIII